MPHSKSLNFAGLAALAALAALLSAIGGGAREAMADGYRKAPGADPSYQHERRPAHDAGRRGTGRRYDPNDLPSGIPPSDIDLNAPGGPESLFEIIRRNSR